MLRDVEIKGKYPVLGSDKNSGGLPILYEDGKLYANHRSFHSLVIGATGSKKSRLIAMPMVMNLLQAGENIVVSDPKGEIYEHTKLVAEREGYQILSLNFKNMEKSDSWNPMEYIMQGFSTGHYDRSFAKVNDFWRKAVLSFCQSPKDPFWNNAPTEVLSNAFAVYAMSKRSWSLPVFYHCYQEFLDKEEDPHACIYPELNKYFEGEALKLSNFVQTKENSPNPSIKSIMDTTLMGLSLNNKDLHAILRKSSFDLLDFVTRKCILYLITPDTTSAYDGYINLFVEQLYNRLSDYLEETGKKELSRRVNFILDEFANIPTIQNFGLYISTCRSKKIRFTLFLQNIGQLNKYGMTGRSVIIGNCLNIAYLYSPDQESQELILKEVHGMLDQHGLDALDYKKGECIMKLGEEEPYIANLKDIDELLYAYRMEHWEEEFDDDDYVDEDAIREEARKAAEARRTVDFSAYKDNEDFMDILEHLRCEPLDCEAQVADRLDFDYDVVEKYYPLAQAVVAEEMQLGLLGGYGVDLVEGYMDHLLK